MNNIDYGTMPIGKLIAKLAIPGIITMVIASLNMVIDGAFMGNFLGSDALAAVNLIMPVTMIVFGLVDLISSGASIRIGILLGKNEKIKASQIFSASTAIIFGLGCIITLFALFFTKPLIFAFIKDTTLATLAYDYAKVYILAVPFIAPLFAFDNFLWICGKVNKSTWINVFTSILNIFLNWYFIVFLRLGIFYAALATVISMVVGSVFSIVPFISNKLELKFVNPKISFKDLKMIIYNGSSEFFENISGSFMTILTNGIMLSVAGASGVAAMSVISYIEMLLMPILAGVIGSVQSIVSYNYGAKKYGRVTETFKKVSIISAIISAIALAIMLLFPSYLVSLFASENDTAMVEIAVTGLLLYAPSYLFAWFNILVGTFLTAFEKAKESVILMSLDSIVFPIIFFVLLSQTMGVMGMFLAQTIAALASCVVSLFMWRKSSLKHLK